MKLNTIFKSKGKYSDWEIGVLFLFLGLITTGMWAHLDTISGLAFTVLILNLIISYVLLRKPKLQTESVQKEQAIKTESLRKITTQKKSSRFQSLIFFLKEHKQNIIYLFILLTPLLSHYFLTLDWEFPFSGDHDHHVFANATAYEFYSNNWGTVTLLFAGLILLSKYLRDIYWVAIFTFIICIGCFFIELPDYYFFRYPGTSYILNFPFFKLGVLLQFSNIVNYLKVGNLLAPFTWIFIFRPYFFKNKLGWDSWIVLALFVLLQQSYIYFIDSVYLESWALILILMSLEALFTENIRIIYPALFIGLACAVKDSAVFMVPFVLLAQVYIHRKTLSHLKTIIGTCFSAFTPFLIYYFARTQAQIPRTFEFSNFDDLFIPTKIENTLFRVTDQFHLLGLSIFIFITLASLVFLLKKQSKDLIPCLILFFGGVFQVGLFYIDKNSSDYPAYPRLHLFPYLLLFAAPPFIIFKNLTQNLKYILVGFIIIAQSFTLLPFLYELKDNSLSHSYEEDYGVPLYYPLRQLISKAETHGLISMGSHINILQQNFNTHFQVMSLAYQDLVSKFNMIGLPVSLPGKECYCRNNEAFLLPFLKPMNLQIKFPHPPYGFKGNNVDSECYQNLKKSCSHCVDIKSDFADGNLSSSNPDNVFGILCI